ncbi:MAG: hypothetical protein LBE34_07790 [Flavobacteriaceae bacterium]|jgi:hypothetical protein|nr:hypothetical protein [Flavobacteriaceae bacterium]
MKTLQSNLQLLKKLAFPLVIAIMSSVFFVSVHAQQKESFKVKNTTVQYQISKETTDKDLEEIKKEINQEKVAVLEFSNIKRNNKGEIIALNTQFKDERGSSQSKSEYNSQGISPFSVAIHQNEQGYKYLQITNGTASALPLTNQQNARSNATPNLSEDAFFAPDFMELMQAMQTDMQRQQDMMQQMIQQVTNSSAQHQQQKSTEQPKNKTTKK